MAGVSGAGRGEHGSQETEMQKIQNGPNQRTM